MQKTLHLDLPQVLTPPSAPSPVVQVNFSKSTLTITTWATATHQEQIYERQVFKPSANTLIDLGVVAFATGWALNTNQVNNSPAVTIAVVGLVSYIGVSVLLQTSVQTERKYERLPGPDNVITKTVQGPQTVVPVANESLFTDRWGPIQTDVNGIATFPASPTTFDQGIAIHDFQSGYEWEIRRIQKRRTVKKDWVDTAQRLHLAAAAGDTIWEIVQAITEGIDVPVALASLAAEIGVTVAIEHFGTTTQQYYDWAVVQVKSPDQ